MLGTPRARVNSLAFAASWMICIFALGAIAIAISGGTDAAASDESGGPTVWKIVFGVVLVGIGLRYWRRRPRGDSQADPPKWMRAVDRFDAARAAGLAFVLSVLNPKNLVLVLSAAAAISGAGVSSEDELLVLTIFTLIATGGVATPIVVYLALGKRSEPILARLKSWMIANNPVVMTAICLLLGAFLITEGLAGL